MKAKCIATILLLLLTINVSVADNKIENKELAKFFKKIKSAKGKHIEYEKLDYEEILKEINKQINEQLPDEYKHIKLKINFDADNVIKVSSKDERGYQILNEITDNHKLDDSKEFAGIPLFSNVKDNGSYTVIYSNTENTLIIDNNLLEKKIHITYFDIAISELIENFIKTIFSGFANELDFFKTLKDVEISNTDKDGEIEFSVKIDYTADEDTSDAELQRDNELLSIEQPQFWKDPVSEKWCIVVPEEYIVSSVEEAENPRRDPPLLWLNSLNFADVKISENQKGYLFTPENLLAGYMVENNIVALPEDELKVSPEFACIANKSVSGGVPYIVSRQGYNAKGREEMLSDIGFLFEMPDGSDFFGMKKSRTVKVNINDELKTHFCAFVGEDAMLLISDDAVNNTCLAVAVIPGLDFFEQYLNEYTLNGEKEIARKANFILSESGLIITKEPFECNGTVHTGGVHLNHKDIVTNYRVTRASGYLIKK